MYARRASTRMIALAMLLATAASPAAHGQDAVLQFQQLQDQANAALERQRRDEGYRPTRATALDQSLEQLLNSGYGIVATQQTPSGGHALTLRDRTGGKCVLCVLASRPSGNAQQTDFDSLCRALN